jgi:hypothetical protein
MRNPNYRYEENNGVSNSPDAPVGGWLIVLSDNSTVWGKTKAAARSRLLRMTRRNAKLTATQANQEEVNDQS